MIGMGSCGESAIVDDPKGMPVMDQHLCSVIPVQLVSVQESCSKEDCSVFDSNVDLSGIADGCMEEGHVDSTSFVDVTQGSRDDLGNESENADVPQLEETAEDDCQISLGICCGDTEVSCLESGGLGSAGNFQDEDNFDLPSEPITADNLQKHFAQQGEQKDDKSNIIPLAGDDSAVVDGKNDDADLLAGDFNSVHEFRHSEMTLESDPMADLLVGCYQENEPEVIMINVDTLSKVAESSDALDWTEANSCRKISPSLGMAVPSGALYAEDTKVESTSDKLHDQKDCDSTSEEKIRAVVDKEITINTYAQASSLPDCHRALDSSLVVDSMCEPTLLDPGNEPKNAILQIEENLCNLKDCSTEGTPNSTIRKPLYPESGQPLTTLITNSSSEGVPYLLAKGDSVSINNNCSLDIPVQTTDDQKETVEIDGITDGILLPTQRNSRRTKLGRKTQTKKASRKFKSKASVTDLGWGMNINLEAARKRRSCLSKPARSSMWGLVGNVEQFLQQENGLEAHEAMYQEVGKAKSKHQSEKVIKNGPSSSSVSTVQKHSVSASTTRVRLKIKFGKEIDLSCSNALILESVDGLASASCLGSNSGSQKVGGNAGDKVAFSKLESSKNDPDKDGVVLNGQIVNSQLENAKETEKLDGDAEEPCHAVPPERVVEALVKPIDNTVIDPGTSPDSEVINSIPEVQVGERQDRHEDDLHHAVLGSSKEFNSSLNVTTSKKGKKKDKLICSGNCITEDGSQGLPRNNRAKHSKNRRHKKNRSDVISSLELPTSTELSKSVGSKELSAEARSLSGEIELGSSTEALKVKSHMEVKTPCKPSVDKEFSEAQGSENLLPSTRPLGRKLPKSLTPIKVSKAKSKAPDSASMKQTTTGRKEKQKRPINKSGVKGKGDSLKVTCEVDDHPHPDVVGNHWSVAVRTINTSDNRVSVDVSNLDMLPGVGLGEQHQSPRNAWVSCDDCHKWRRIPAGLADLIDETKCAWTCKDSSDTAFADCAIPQEKSNAEINAELGISDASGEEDACEGSKNYKQLEYRLPMVPQKSTFTHILTNEYLHRSQKTQTIDEIMVCHCKSPPEGKLGCRDECLNRMLNIECVQGTCPCGDRCANQQFQKRKYSSLKWFKCGKKGYGLKALERVAKGQFIIEYVGEVLDMHAYEARQREYALKGHRHFYFMTLNGSEVIDASAKGNLGRFINHSCDPNCRTEKWMVNGEICIGLFALRDIKQDEELTFDYNYVRVFGAAAKQCYCGSPLCRGYIGGGDPLKAELIVQGDSDEEFAEPVMLSEGGKIEDNILMPKYFGNVDTKSSRHSLKDRDVLDKSTTAIDADGSSEKESSMNPTSAVSLLHSSVEVEDSNGKLPSSDRVEETSQQMEEITSKPMPSVQQGYAVESESAEKSSSIPRLEAASFLTTVSQALSNSTDGDREFKSDMVDERNGCSQSHLLVKNPKLNGSVKKGKVRAKSAKGVTSEVTAFQLPLSSIKQKKVAEGSSNGRFEAVQGKLNELLDVNGGISKRKDATKGYLKLLLLTVASGDRSNGEAIQSNRDLSMILGALLKTKSRAVLNDIINKNGLQMLHKILKQYRQDFKKIPILRKLLKVLEYLAEGKILTPEHINSGPPCRGMESFRESVLSLTEHDDKQVHQIARSFRDRWIPRFLRKNGYMDRDDNRAESHRSFNGNRFAASHNHMHEQDLRPSEAIDCAQQSMLVTTVVDAGAQEGCYRVSLDGVEIKGARKRKRKSRWDQPAETNSYSDAVINSTDESQKIHEDIPPGFSCPLRSANTAINSGHPALQVSGHSGCHLAIGHPKEKYNSRLPVSYGMPLSVSQQYGTPHVEITGCWVIAPGMPFNPFPPLPPYPRDNKDRQPSNTDAMTIDQPAEPSNTDAMTIDQSAEPSNTDAMTIDQPAEVKQWDASDPVNCCSDNMIPNTTGANSEEMNSQCEENKHEAKRLKGDSTDLGTTYFRQQKWNNSKIHRPWFRRNGWKGIGNNSSGDMRNIEVDVPEESKVTCSLEDATGRDEKEI